MNSTNTNMQDITDLMQDPTRPGPNFIVKIGRGIKGYFVKKCRERYADTKYARANFAFDVMKAIVTVVSIDLIFILEYVTTSNMSDPATVHELYKGAADYAMMCFAFPTTALALSASVEFKERILKRHIEIMQKPYENVALQYTDTTPETS